MQRDFSGGRYIIAPYYYGPGPGGGSGSVEATVEVHFPGGQTETLTRELRYAPPYDQWFALLVDASAGSCKILDFFLEGNLVALLEWDSAADLDLAVWSYDDEEVYFPFDCGGYDFAGGWEGLETFCFGFYSGPEKVCDFATGLVDVLVLMDYPGYPPTRAVVTFIAADYMLLRFEHNFTPDPQGDYCWQVLRELNLDTLEFLELEEEETRFYF